MSLHRYFADISQELKRESQKIREYFATHKPTAGANREDLVAQFLSQYLPKKYNIGSGLILSTNGEFSNQADIVVTDQMSNAPLFSDLKEKIWLVESVYSLIEVKTQFTPTTLKDSIDKCRRFKQLPRMFASDFGRQNIRESLFVLWAFDGPSPDKIKETWLESVQGVPRLEHPDFIVIPGTVLIRAGHYYELSLLGQPNSPYWNQKVQETGGNIEILLGDGYEVLYLGDNTILGWLTWFSSWLHAAGERRVQLEKYVPDDYKWGHKI